jgi:threonine aldolase
MALRPSSADFRSDTVTKPTRAMADAMHAAALDPDSVGDDVYGEDPTVRSIEARVATLLGKAAAVFVPTCTMANLLAVGAHCGRGDEVLLGSESHIFVYEQGGGSWIMGTAFHPIPNAPDGTLPIAALEAALALRGGGADAHMARPGLICVENTQNRCGGTALPVSYMDAVAALAAAHGLPLHCDGARLLNAATALGVPPARLVAGCSTVSLCLSKGLGAPLGALLVGGQAIVDRARRLRKAVGGGMRQAGVVAAAGLIALDEQTPRLAADHRRAAALTAGLALIPGLEAPPSVDTNIVYFGLDPLRLAASHWHVRAAAATAAGASTVTDAVTGVSVPTDAVPTDTASASAVFAALLRSAAQVRVGSYGSSRLRAVTHHQVGDAEVAALLKGAAIAARLLSQPPDSL